MPTEPDAESGDTTADAVEEQDTTLESAEQAVAEEPVEAPPPDPRAVEMDALRAALAAAQTRADNKDAMLSTAFNAITANRNAGNVVDDTPRLTVTQDMIEEAQEAGDSKKVARLISLMTDEKMALAMHRVRRESVDPIANQLTGYGLPAVASLTKELLSRDPKLKYFERFKNDIEKHLVNLSPEAQINPDVIRAAYKHEVGEHVDQLIEEEVERRMRKDVANPGAAPTAKRAGRKQGDTAIPTVEQLHGPEMAREIDRKGGADLWAKKFGFKGWNDYVTKTAGGSA